VQLEGKFMAERQQDHLLVVDSQRNLLLL
jgi:hypothetical protein